MALSKSERVEVRVSPFQKEEWGKAAGGIGKIGAWLRDLADVESARVNALPGSGRSGNGHVEEGIKAKDGATVVEDFPARKPEPSEPEKCPRWFHHRKGRYCGTCGKTQ